MPRERTVGVAPASRRLRIATLTTLFPNQQQPIHGTFVSERIKALSRLGEVRVVAPVPWAPPLRALGERYYRYSRVGREERQGDIEVRHPRFFVIPKFLKSTDGLLMGLACLKPLLRLRKKFKFDLIDAHWAYPDGMAAAIVARILGVPLCITVRGDDINIFAREPWRRPCIRWAMKQADIVIALSEELKRGVEELGVDPARVVVISNGVDTQRFHPVDRLEARRQVGLPEEDRILLSVGRLHHSKGFPILVDALGRLKDSMPDLKLVIAGSSDPEADSKPAILEMAAKYGIADRVLLVGPQPPQSLKAWYGASDLFCLATSREGSANVLIEALACGVPCVTTPVGGNPEIICNSECGVLVPADAGEMAGAIASCLSRSWDKSRVAAQIQTRTWQSVADVYYMHLQRIAGEINETEFVK